MQKWIDLSAQGIYLGDQKMADGKHRLVVLDMDNRGDPARLAEIGFRPVSGSPRYDRGIYYLHGDDQRLRPKALASAFGLPACPLVEIEAGEIDALFRQKIEEKFGANLNAVVMRSQPLGQNRAGQYVYESPSGRFIRLSTVNAVSEGSQQAEKLGRAAFLRATNDEELRACAEGFLWTIRQGGKTTWNDLARFAKVVYAHELPRGEAPDDARLHRLQEALEAAAYRRFTALATAPDEAAFKSATDFYYGLPAARMRTAESVYLQQYSTPLPMAVVSQRLLAGDDDLAGKSVLEPTAGNGGLLNLLPSEARLYASELDENRLAALGETGRVSVLHGDATVLAFRERFGAADGFDYTIANPPFGQMERSQRYDKLPDVRRFDHYIALRALGARKDQGRSVMILGADSSQSDGTVKGGSKSLLNYLHDHYEVHGVTEVDGRLYARHGAGYNIRIVVVGDKRAEPVEAEVPEKLTIISSYDDLWNWSSHVIERYAAPKPAPEIGVDALAFGEAAPVFGGEAPAIQPVPEAGEEETITAADESVGSRRPPWEMTLREWDAALAETRPGAESAAALAAKMEHAEYLRYGVTDWAREKLERAQRDEIKITSDELAEITDRLNTRVSHRDVIDKALAEGQPVPQAVLADYPDLSAPPERRVNEFQAPYQAASKVGEPSTMVPINMAGAIYGALNDLEAVHGPIDEYVAAKLRYDREELPRYFSPEQIDALGLAIKSVEEGRGIINADQTGIGKGRWVAAMLRYAKLEGKTPVFLTIKPELFTDIFRDINDIGSADLFKKLFIFNDGESVKKFGTEDQVLYRATSAQERKSALASGTVDPDTDMVLATYSQFMRAYERNPKAKLLTEIAANGGMLVLDEAHVASGASNLSATVGQAVGNSDAVLYASATPLKGVSNFSIYNKVFPASVDLKSLPDTLRTGGEALQEAISANMARDGVLIRREHDFSKLVFHTRNPSDERREQNVALANSLSEIVSGLSYLAGDVARQVAVMNRGYRDDWEEIPDRDRQGMRMQASSMNFGSRLYSLNRQFLLGVKIEEAVEAALEALEHGRKPVIAVENTGESLLRQVIARRAGVDHLEAELLELDEKGAVLTPEETARRAVLVASIGDALRNVVLDDPPQYRELLESMLDRIGVIKVQGRYGDVSREAPESEEYHEAAERLRERIREFPDLPLTPIDVVKKELELRGHPVGEVSGRTASLVPSEADPARWVVKFHPKADAVANVAGFQNGRYDGIVITRSGSTGISLHATDRFADSDIRQRDFIVLQKAANIAEFLQWMGRVNRKDQVVPPVITGLESGLPAELRLTMMHNSKLRKLSANTTSNRENANLEGEELDLLNEVGDRVALEWLAENPDVADYLDIRLPEDDEDLLSSRMSQDCPYINKLMGRLMMVPVDRQEEILKTLTERFADKLEELEQRGENPFKVDAFEWGAEVVKEEDLVSGVIRTTGSTFDEPVKLVTVRFEQDVYPVRSEKLDALVKAGTEQFKSHGSVDDRGSLRRFKEQLMDLRDDWVRTQLPGKLRGQTEPLTTLLESKEAVGARSAMDKANWLIQNIADFKPGMRVPYEDTFKGERKGVILSVDLPADKDDLFLLSRYRAKVVFPGDDKAREITLATVRTQGYDLYSGSWQNLVPGEDRSPYQREQGAIIRKEFDAAPDGKIIREQYLLQGNIFRACELANEQRLGAPILFTDKDGNRQRAVLMRDRITPDMVKAMPVALDARDMRDYVDEFLRPDHPEHPSRSTPGALTIRDSGVKDSKRGDGIMLESYHSGRSFALTLPGTKAKAGALLTDGTIFDIGTQTAQGSLRLQLSGDRRCMRAEVSREVLPELLERLQRNQHVGRFYVAQPDLEAINTMKMRFRQDREREAEVESCTSLTP
ncbi:Helicase. putatve [Xanthomonas citri pv. citri]|uniref:Helicase. putatve n=1 Tax=Xanthomonas citri pv. citri TaxID=611301 RepID=A0A0U5BNZ6_XANCI|nr:Helicase. putatve [Xanthomonas citri pv. citri]CEG14723.1 Helicase. putatve [Xanthomonas citri pv. citri]